jgi:thioesterase domain-containing protein/acyl carrier protein
VPPGVAGELYIGGVGLSRGYLNRPDLTDEKFIANPFYDANDPVLSLCSERLYKTGDLVRWLPDGNLEYLGRIDLQVKVRGFRIELGEIENALNSHAQVNDAVVLAKDGASGDKRLIAYVVPVVSNEDASLVAQDESEAAIVARHALIEGLRQHLGRTLQDYMVPAAFVLLDSLPLTPNGKIDRKALPEPDAAQQQAAYVAPRNDLEQQLCAVWQEVLGLERVGITDNFFQLGGHSLMAVQLMSRIRQASGVEIPLRTLFVAPTVEMLAASISAESARAEFSNLVPIRPTGNLPPLFLIHPGEGEIGYARVIAPYLDADLPVYALAAIGFLDGEATLQSIPEMASTYLRAIRHVQPHGPYRVAGWSAGGTIAYEIARQLLNVGDVVEYLGLIDTTSDYFALKQRLALPLRANVEVGADLDDSAILLASLAQDVPQSLLQELQALAASGSVTAMLERCRSAGIFPAGIDTTTLRRHLAVRASIQRALIDYVPLPLPVRVTLFTATEGARTDLAQGWAALAQAGMEVLRVQGNHYSIMDSPNVQALGQALSESILIAT